MDKWTEALDIGHELEIIYVESKIFDTAPHVRLHGMLEQYGIKGKTIDWIKVFSDKGNKGLRIKGLIGPTTTANQSQLALSKCHFWAKLFYHINILNDRQL